MEDTLDPPEDADTQIGIGSFPRNEGPQRSPLGAGYVLLVARELTGMSQRRLADALGTSQPTLARIETGERMPSVRTLLRLTETAGFDLVVGLRHRGRREPDPAVLEELGFALVGTLHPNPDDGLADFAVLHEPSVFEGPPDG